MKQIWTSLFLAISFFLSEVTINAQQSNNSIQPTNTIVPSATVSYSIQDYLIVDPDTKVLYFTQQDSELVSHVNIKAGTAVQGEVSFTAMIEGVSCQLTPNQVGKEEQNIRISFPLSNIVESKTRWMESKITFILDRNDPDVPNVHLSYTLPVRRSSFGSSEVPTKKPVMAIENLKVNEIVPNEYQIVELFSQPDSLTFQFKISATDLKQPTDTLLICLFKNGNVITKKEVLFDIRNDITYFITESLLSAPPQGQTDALPLVPGESLSSTMGKHHQGQTDALPLAPGESLSGNEGKRSLPSRNGAQQQEKAGDYSFFITAKLQNNQTSAQTYARISTVEPSIFTPLNLLLGSFVILLILCMYYLLKLRPINPLVDKAREVYFILRNTNLDSEERNRQQQEQFKSRWKQECFNEEFTNHIKQYVFDEDTLRELSQKIAPHIARDIQVFLRRSIESRKRKKEERISPSNPIGDNLVKEITDDLDAPTTKYSTPRSVPSDPFAHFPSEICNILRFYNNNIPDALNENQLEKWQQDIFQKYDDQVEYVKVPGIAHVGALDSWDELEITPAFSGNFLLYTLESGQEALLFPLPWLNFTKGDALYRQLDPFYEIPDTDNVLSVIAIKKPSRLQKIMNNKWRVIEKGQIEWNMEQ